MSNDLQFDRGEFTIYNDFVEIFKKCSYIKNVRFFIK